MHKLPLSRYHYIYETIEFRKITFTKTHFQERQSTRPKITTSKIESDNITTFIPILLITIKFAITNKQNYHKRLKKSYLYNKTLYNIQYLIIYKNILLRVPVGRSIKSVRNDCQ